jgi:glycosyltransferase involved in cell wall biosynthesis
VPRAASAADAVVTVSTFSKRELLDTLDVPPSAVHVVYNGIDPLFLSGDEGSPLDLSEPYILFVGAMNPRKNVARLVEAFDRAKRRLDLPHELVLIGPTDKAIFKRIDVATTDGIVLPGFVAEAELKYVYTNADAFVYPSLYEGFGLPPLEAMACGTPVVTSNVSSLPEVVGDAAELVDPTSVATISDGIERVLTDDVYRHNLVQRGYERSETFSWERAGERTLSVLQSVV